MKNIQKIGIILTFIAFTSIGCSNASTEESSSDVSPVTENSVASTEEVSSNISSVLKNPVLGEKVTLQGKIIEQTEDCFIFTDGDDKIMIHFEDEQLSYDSSTLVEISGTVENSVEHDSEHSKAGHNHDDLMNTMIMVDRMKVIYPTKES